MVETAGAIWAADPEAKILIAGAAGGSEQFLSFYRQVLSDQKVVEAFDIGNVHCISDNSINSFNVEPYQNFLGGLRINKPVWVTEAEAIVSAEAGENATQVYNSTKKALELGAERIFYVMYDFVYIPGGDGDRLPPHCPITVNSDLDPTDPIKVFQVITKLQ